MVMVRKRVTRMHSDEPEDADVDDDLPEDDGGEDEEEPALDEVDEDSSSADLDRIEAKYTARAKSPLKAIRAFCVLCMGCQPRQVAFCTATKCVLYPFRFGRNPFQSRKKG